MVVLLLMGSVPIVVYANELVDRSGRATSTASPL